MFNRWFHPVYLLALALLLLNDFWWKSTFGNAITGKLSDVAGVLAFAWFWATIFPRWANISFAATVVGFAWWKSPLATPLIICLQELSLPVQRVIDPTDLWALLVLPAGYYLWLHPHSFSLKRRPRWSVLMVGMVSLFAFSATSIVRHNYTYPPGDLALNQFYEIKLSSKQVLDYMKKEGLVVEKLPEPTDTIEYFYSNSPMYRIPEYITDYQDTIRNIHFSLNEYEANKTVLRLINLTLVTEYNLQSWETMKDLHRMYRRHFKHHLIKPLRKSRQD